MGLIGESIPMKRLRDQVKRIGPTDVSILIYGESGTGKEAVARAIHKVSSRSHKPFLSINCRALNEQRFQAEVVLALMLMTIWKQVCLSRLMVVPCFSTIS